MNFILNTDENTKLQVKTSRSDVNTAVVYAILYFVHFFHTVMATSTINLYNFGLNMMH